MLVIPLQTLIFTRHIPQQWFPDSLKCIITNNYKHFVSRNYYTLETKDLSVCEYSVIYCM